MTVTVKETEGMDQWAQTVSYACDPCLYCLGPELGCPQMRGHHSASVSVCVTACMRATSDAHQNNLQGLPLDVVLRECGLYGLHGGALKERHIIKLF